MLLFRVTGLRLLDPWPLGCVRVEIEPNVIVEQQINPEKVTSVSMAGVFRNCPLLKACPYETYRMVNEPTSIRYVARPITINDGTCKHELKPGMFVSAPHALRQRDPSMHDDPDTCFPYRFLETDLATGELVARHKRLRPWGSGARICKGRTFAEKEIKLLGACVISMWDNIPAHGA